MKKLGILGGMGPAASATFVNRLISQTPAKCDQEHLPFVLWNEPRIPDRSTSIQNGDDLPLSWLEEGILGLQRSGCDYVVIPCNTAHYWYDHLCKLNIPIIHIVDSIASELDELNLITNRVGILGTKGTIESGLYQDRLSKQGWECIIPSSHDMDTLIQPAIELIKAGKVKEPQQLLITAIHNLIDKEVKAIVLGCTELPLVIGTKQEENVPIVNSIDSLVKAVLTCWLEDYP